MKIYLCGKYSGIPHDKAVAKFAKTKQQLIDVGVDISDIVNPMELGMPSTTPWDEAMKTCLTALSKCDTMFIQRDWKESFGARKEITVADQRGYALYWEERGDIELIRRHSHISAACFLKRKQTNKQIK